MQLKSVSVQVRVSIPLGQFNNISPAVSLTAELQDGEDVDKVYSELSKVATRLFLLEASNHEVLSSSIMRRGIGPTASDYLCQLVEAQGATAK